MSGSGPALPAAWGAAWIEQLALAWSLDASRFSRGRGLVARGGLDDFSVEPGSVGASVRGRSVLERRVRLGVRRFTDDQWAVVRQELAGSGRLVAAVLEGSLPRALSDRLEAIGCGLLPGVGDVSIDCTCGHHAEFCVHAAALCCRLADALDEDPLLLVTLRGGDRSTLISGPMVGSMVGPAAASMPASFGGAGRASDHRPSAIPGRPADPGMAAGSAWRRRPDALPDIASSRRAVGRPRVGAVGPSAELGFDQGGLDRLVRDAAQRAVALLDGAPSATTGLEFDVAIDAARRSTAATLAPGETASAVLATAAGVSPDLAPAVAAAWDRCGAAGVEVLIRPRRLHPDELAAIVDAFEVEVKARSTGAVLPGGRQVRRAADGTWVVLGTDAAGGWSIVDAGSVLEELTL